MAFVHSITSAGVVHSIAKACSDGALLNCACDPTKRSGRGSDSEGEFDWTGCSDNVKFGVKFARLFIDAKESETRDARGLMNLHNNSAGRRVSTTKLSFPTTALLMEFSKPEIDFIHNHDVC